MLGGIMSVGDVKPVINDAAVVVAGAGGGGGVTIGVALGSAAGCM